MKKNRILLQLQATDYRHYICLAITLGFLGCGFVFPNALPRFAEALRDLVFSIVYYFCSIIDVPSPLPVTVMELPSWQFAPSRFAPLSLLPASWDEFKAFWGEYWRTWATWENVEAYLKLLGDILYYFSKLLLILMPLALLVWLLLSRYTGQVNNDHGKESKPLQRWRRFTFKVVSPVVQWVRSFWDFVKSSPYKSLWTFLWVMFFNIPSVVVAFFAFYLYFICSFDFLSIYGQLLKLMVDAAPLVRFIPVTIWVVIGFWAVNAICRSEAKAKLEHCERMNRGFINERGILTTVWGVMNAGKTSMLTSMSLSAEVELHDMALEILLECDVMYPSFPWDKLRLEIQKRMETKELVDVPSIRKWIRSYCLRFAQLRLKPQWCKWWHRQVKRLNLEDPTFGYDFEHYPMEYNDELKVSSIYEAIEDYACAYFVYTIETSLIISNYSIRSDAIKEDLGNFPLWNHDFFDRDPRLMDAFSRHSHIIDYDMIRLGEKMLKDNPNRNALGFGVYVVSEIDKERKNMLDLKETKIKDEGCNQRNDLFNAGVKMIRHAVTIRNRCFIRLLFDLQRPEDWGANGRDVGDVVFIEDKGEMAPVLPFFSPFWLCEGVFKWIKGKYDRFYTEYIYKRGDGTLFVHLLRTVISKIDNHYRKVNNAYGCQVLNLKLDSGRMDGSGTVSRKYYKLSKKDYSNRYCTDCLAFIWEGDAPNQISIADLPTYADILATSEEYALQNSHFYNDVTKWKAA